MPYSALAYDNIPAENTYFIGVIYHPPNPVYATAMLLLSLDRDIQAIRTLSSSAQIVLGGYLNQLALEKICEVTDLISAVSAPTRRESHLDHLLVSDTFYSHNKVVRHVLRSDHMAIVAYTGEVKIN